MSRKQEFARYPHTFIRTSMLRNFLFGFLLILSFGLLMSILSFHLDHRFGYLCFDRWKTQASPPVNHSISLQNRSIQYIWCVNHYGPNNQLKDFVKCCIIAMMNNYTLIVPPVYPHYHEKMRGVQWLEHFYDLKPLKSIFNFITLDQFILEKLNQKKLSIDCYVRQVELVDGRSWYSMNTINSIQNSYKIHIAFARHINLSRHFNLKELGNKSNDCSSIFLHIHYTTFGQFFSSPNFYAKSIFEHLHRNVLIQRMSTELIKSLPEFLINKRNHSHHQLTTLAVIHMRLGDHTVMSVSRYIQKILDLIKTGVRFTHMHIMCPYLNGTDIANLAQHLPIPFTITQHLISHVRYVLDGYLFDIFEQEIAYQAPIFLASPWTTYSATVLMQKVYQDKGMVYILSSKDKTPALLVTKKNVKYFK